ncbi:MAG: tetratricopeptide repeat protein [Bacteroidia bacterium]|nr:tetratricopeptide repeat protein [Bacteroidia bacterium]
MLKKKTAAPGAAPVAPGPTTPLSPRFLYVLCAISAFLLYANTLGHDFTVDDTTVIKNNKFTTQGLAGLDDIFTSSYRAGYWDRTEGLYRPLSVAMFAVEWWLAPDKAWPGHLMNVLLYALTAVALFSLLQRLLKHMHPLIPLLVTLLWVFHPLHTEVVANIKSRDELLSFLFGLLALKGLMRYTEQKQLPALILSALAFFMALLSKENSVTWAGVFPLALWCFGAADLKKTIRLSSIYLLITALYFLIRLAVLGEITGGYELMLINNSMVGAESMATQLATALSVLGKYLFLFVLPVTLVFDYSYNTIPNVTFGSPAALLSALVIIGAFLYALKQVPRRSPLAFSILFFFGTIALVSNVFFLIEATMAERFVYTPSLGLCLLCGCLVNGFLQKRNKKVKEPGLPNALWKNPVFMPLMAVLILFGGRTISRNMDWKNNLTLLLHDVKVSPESARIRYALGSTLLVEEALKAPEGSVQRSNLLDRSIDELSKGVSILPNYNDAWYHLGIAYKEKGDAKNAVAAFEQARSYKAFTEASRFISAGVAYGMNRQYDKALADLESAVRLAPDDADAWNNYGLYLSEAGQAAASLDALNKALALKPDFDKAYYNRGNTRAKAGDYRQALTDYGIALSYNGSYTDALNNSGNCYVMMQKFDSALVFFRRAVEADPANVKAVMNLAVTLQNLGDTATARTFFEKARNMGARP